MVLIGMWFNDDTRISLVVGIIFLAIVTISFYAFGIGKRAPLDVQNNKEISVNKKRLFIWNSLFLLLLFVDKSIYLDESLI